ncbi:prenyltransferase/squalene oxidase repeat-containing protein [Urbifossiella limnaea]|uniref:Prenyltransferase and squalene oxidase repeat protein n=1 Tax=Urbifossiella limnaea TaxID=2528023 RepID=A0A517XXQ4_9BACT|nr:prenyltransferase/squalene oxidase repeat-containing protein [Urbifossiella limnaea]QDU22271.1 Prenyltransferase and squalene oxidase repeat protein [Urbifossiella limnaea]
MRRLYLLPAAVALLLTYTPTAPVAAQPPAEAPRAAPVKDRVKMDDATKKAVAKSLRWLKDQQAADGSWGNTAITSFALLSFMANGHLPNQGEYGPEVARGVRYLLACTRDDGYVVGPRGGNMYCHGMAALALSQVYGMTGDEDVRKTLKKAIDLIVRTQNHEGGWRYDPAPTGADISVTIMQVMALRGAKDGGIHVPDRTIAEAVRYINRCYDRRTGGYRYQPFSSGPGYARTAAGVCVLQLSGDFDADEIKKAVEYMERTGEDRQHYWYGEYYAAHALNQIGGEQWEAYYNRMRTQLLGSQRPSGEWYDSRREAAYGPVYQTAIAVLVLSVPTHYLPIYQK